MICKKFFEYTAIFLLIILSHTTFLKSENISNNNQDDSSIKKLYETWHRAVESSNIDGYINSLDKNITLIPPGGSVISGAENYREFLGPVFNLLLIKFKMVNMIAK